MSTTFTALTLDPAAITFAGAAGSYAVLNSSASVLAIAGQLNITTIKNDGTDAFPTKQSIGNGLSSSAYQTLQFWESIEPNRLIFKGGQQLYWMDESGDQDGYVYTGANSIIGTGMSSVDSSILDIPGTVHLADSGYGTTYVWGLDEGSPIGQNPPQEYNMGGGFWWGVRYSPDGVYVACMQTGAGLRILKRNGDTYTLLASIPQPATLYTKWCDFSGDSLQIAAGGEGSAFGLRVWNINPATDEVTLDPTVYGDPTKNCIPLYCGQDGALLAAFSISDTSHEVYQKSGTTLTLDPDTNIASVVGTSVSFAQKAKNRPEIISLAFAGAPSYGVFKIDTSEALYIDASDFAGPMGAFDAELKLTGRVESASFVGPTGNFDTLLVDPAGDPTDEYIRHGTARMVLEGTAAAYEDITPPTYLATQTAFVGPMGRAGARLTLWPEVEGGFVGPHGRSAAVLEYGNAVETAGFVGPHGSFAAELLLPGSLEAGFVGPSSRFSADLAHYTVAADFVGPFGQFSAQLFGDDGLFGQFVGPSPNFEAELKLHEDLEAGFVGPFGYFSGQLGEDVRTVQADFVGPSGRFETELYTPEAVTAGFVGPMGRTAAQLDVIEEINGGFVGPLGSFNAFVARGPGIDAFFRGPRPNFNAELEREANTSQLSLLLIQP
jgi:hypothetical protein